MGFAQICKIEMISTCFVFGDVLERLDFIFAQKRHKTAVASALNSNNNKENSALTITTISLANTKQR